MATIGEGLRTVGRKIAAINNKLQDPEIIRRLNEAAAEQRAKDEIWEAAERARRAQGTQRP